MQLSTSNIAALAKANANRNANWAADANNLIEQALVHPLQEGLNYVTMGAGFLALIPGLEPLMVVAGAASLANAGISALEGSYMSAGMYAVTGVIPFAGKIADIGEMADGAAAALNEAAPAAEVVASDAGQVESQVLAADGVVRQLRMPQINAELPFNVLGETMPNGDVFLRDGLSREEQISTLLHESVHSFLSVGDGEFLAGSRQQFGIWGYKNSQFLRFAEEAIAETYGSGNLLTGILHPFVNDYGVTIAGVTKEIAGYLGGLFSAGYFGYEFGTGNW
jgi:hypothetical protein